jgi:exodeoxyribonuclease V alpha subunit
VSSTEAPTERASRPPTEHLQGIVERVTYHAEDSGYTVARLKVPSHSDLVTIVGSFPTISAGQTVAKTVNYPKQDTAIHTIAGTQP